ncbi:cytochrome P450 [Staphylotrichum tortipilum]|uniref:Cytochrome P450 n=1 Tax=Staphylotrichum tortipilum TaxID=2831512 RepID=A0AAN6MM66_9PEZI|nr:cytochrome P450 [Staphylotrichum longicolle]
MAAKEGGRELSQTNILTLSHPGFPWLGPIHDLPVGMSWLKFTEWGRKFGPIFHLKIFGADHVWISKEEVATELMSKKARIYSDRPLIPNLPNNRTSGEYLALLGSTSTWKTQRKLCNHLMHASNKQELHGYPTEERGLFLHAMGQEPAQYREWIEQFTSRTVGRLCWGTPEVADILRNTTFGLLQTISPEGAAPNMVPVLRHVPGLASPWKKKERARHDLERRLFRRAVDNTVKRTGRRRRRGSVMPQPSFMHTFAEEAEERCRGRMDALTEALNVVGLMAIAGALTIGSPIQSYLLAMMHYPEWQRRLQRELDGVVEGQGCPQWEHREVLPLLRSVIKETIRWRPPVPTGIPHAVEERDDYRGFYVPKGATIHALEWAITRNEAVYPDPECFDPGRWLDPSYPTYREPLSRYPNLNGFSQFGFGRRTCQGIPVVEQDLFMAMGGLAWAFHVLPRTKKPPWWRRPPSLRYWNEFTPLLIAKPKPFPFRLIPRGEDRVVQVRRMFTEIRDYLHREKRRYGVDLAPLAGSMDALVQEMDCRGPYGVDWGTTGRACLLDIDGDGTRLHLDSPLLAFEPPGFRPPRRPRRIGPRSLLDIPEKVRCLFQQARCFIKAFRREGLGFLREIWEARGNRRQYVRMVSFM